jgi:hypothetical protein
MDKRTAASVIEDLKNIVAEKKPLDRGYWLTAAFYLTILGEDVKIELNRLNQEAAKKKQEFIDAQDKKNDSLAQSKLETLDEYKSMKDQEVRVGTIDQLIMVAKKNSDNNESSARKNK